MHRNLQSLGCQLNSFHLRGPHLVTHQPRYHTRRRIAPHKQQIVRMVKSDDGIGERPYGWKRIKLNSDQRTHESDSLKITTVTEPGNPEHSQHKQQLVRMYRTNDSCSEWKRIKLDSDHRTRESDSLNMQTVTEPGDHPAAMPRIELTDVERTLKRLLLDVAYYIECSQGSESETLVTPPIVLRFTGGWVRDKLLGVESQDIDVAIDKMTGFQFGRQMQKYLRTSGNAREYGIGLPDISEDLPSKDGAQPVEKAGNVKKGMGALHKIEANPEKSKHLETVNTRVFGLSIDLVNLRKETYTEDSRNPQMEFGTPEEDALRRDATVNALFYNLNTATVEDFTGRGLTDMRLKIIRTPLEPHQTFMDDPLRVLRLIRFASRLGYTIDPKTELAMNDDNVRKALQVKISRERIGAEVEKILKGPDPHTALSLIDRLNLYLTIFPESPTATDLRPMLDRWQHVYDFVDSLMENPETQLSENNSLQTIKSVLLCGSQDRYNAWLLAAIFPWASTSVASHSKPGTKAGPPLPAIIAKEGLKPTNNDTEVISSACKNANEIASLQRKVITQMEGPVSLRSNGEHVGRDTLGMAIRRWGCTWRSQVFLAMFLDIVRQEQKDIPDESNSIIDDYATFLKHIKHLDLLEAYALKPLVNGTRLASALKTKPGPWMKTALDMVLAWQLRNPGIIDTQGALEEVERHRETLLSK